MTNILLCGGSGTRLWPLSRTLMPKQFLKLFDDKSLFELAVQRNSKICSNVLIVCNEEQYFLALDQISNTNKTRFILEPLAKNTAVAITLACLSLPKEEIVFITPSDHLVKNEKAYQEVIAKALEIANDNYLVTFGIKPDSPHIGYGYIKSKNTYDVEAFIEKPNLKKAKEFLEDGSYLWNSGMFMFKVGFFLEQMQAYSKKIYDFCLKAHKNALIQNDFIKIKSADMEKIPELSIDYALMEKSNKVKVISSDISWSDVGSFESLAKEFSDGKNYTNTNAKFLDSNNIFCYASDKKKFIATIDLDDIFIIDTQDALLISKKSSSQKVKQIHEAIKENENLSKNHLCTHRPWGSFTILEDEKGYKIKRIEVKPGKRLSLQKHFHRNEHWIVLSGTASVEIDGVENLVRPNESIYIKMGQKHRLSNYGKIPVVIIEAQVGEYTGEDDIIRLEDDYKRI
ncbi:mannose-1-phosphate guanylyltransferase/mannose-6-phosphate isomerase [Campylobacter lari]|uniref:mannose-1-phosphate guanylyltransferase/mannose-6-phosphate isomerase n=1 Tax=Campylobacter lari TaxID=201 RepID=UPI0011EAB405|nr:mannose-1-phosphate guanylyltransferase/mannose-6-phosphate isomerase [Campylobacter lari]EAI5067800.1 mannose-1-phosphate guanylyltransferase/mannose-6-phosphate isomerase [Campylobacter jejuni]KAB0590734.1 mannose-1-phosphate guanylyltransferase/mannose-6-phosphate isomerase [Campylobacter lari subsp. concheus]MPC00395.1 mannose-1-phosphate guanylyltransferase/mannose-6-phosphate isomerase [Campylobacter lari]QEL06422.1 bifunctional mannose-6-phosphate isomerase / mannose-1-phosphate guany